MMILMMNKKIILIIILIAVNLCFISGCVNTQTEVIEETTANVSKVIDGDTIQIETGEKVRLLGINAPERGQPYYEEAKTRLEELVEGKEVKLRGDVVTNDQYGRLLRYVFINGKHVNVMLVREGQANVYVIPPNVNYENELYEAQNAAINEGIGIWERSKSNSVCSNGCIGIAYFHYDAEGNDCYNLNDEYVTFKNACSYPCDMTGWTVRDETSRDVYSFPEFVLESGAQVTLYTGCGTYTDTKLYVCTKRDCGAVWNNGGDTLYLRDPYGNLVLSYSY